MSFRHLDPLNYHRNFDILSNFNDILKELMAYHSRSTRRYVKKSRRKFFFSIILVIIILYATINWILPPFITSLGFVTDFFRDKNSKGQNISENPTLAPPVLNIPFEATNTAQIEISGYTVPDTKVEIYLDDDLQTSVNSNSDGNFTVTINLVLGTNNIYGKTLDENNQSSLPSKTIRVIYDNEKPPLEVNSPQDGQTFQGERKITVSGKTEPKAYVSVNDTRVIIDNEGGFSHTYSLNDGENTLIIKASDSASNTAETIKKVTFQPS